MKQFVKKATAVISGTLATVALACTPGSQYSSMDRGDCSAELNTYRCYAGANGQGYWTLVSSVRYYYPMCMTP